MKEKIINFLKGRYGADELHKFLLIICLMLLIVNTFLNNTIIMIIELIIFMIILFRMLSKNIRKRNKENQIYLNIKNKIIKFISYQKDKYKDRNTHMYKKCPNCKQKLRLPLKKGKHTVKCPSCGNKFEVKCNKNEKVKVEIVK